jgi:hypothetical protein
MTFTERQIGVGWRNLKKSEVKVKEPSNKILITLLFWAGDKRQAMKLARLLADLEPVHSTLADFLFVARFDCPHGQDTIKYVSRKFNTHVWTSKRRGVGWPTGCNGVFFGMLDWVYNKISANQIPRYKAILTLGSDGAPFRRDWLSVFHNAWDKARNVKPITSAGALMPGEREHINGDCFMFSTEEGFLRWLARDVQDIRSSVGWDWALANDFKNRGWVNFPFVRSDWRHPGNCKETDWNEYTKQGIVWLHGVRDDSLIELSRKKLL